MGWGRNVQRLHGPLCCPIPSVAAADAQQVLNCRPQTKIAKTECLQKQILVSPAHVQQVRFTSAKPRPPDCSRGLQPTGRRWLVHASWPLPDVAAGLLDWLWCFIRPARLFCWAKALGVPRSCLQTFSSGAVPLSRLPFTLFSRSQSAVRTMIMRKFATQLITRPAQSTNR